MSGLKAPGGIPALVDEPSKLRGPCVLLTHGAGGDKSGQGLTALAESLAQLGHLVVRFDLPYRTLGKKAPPKAEASAPGFFEALEQVRALAPDIPWAVGGKSYGGRVASLAIAQGLNAAGLVFYGYPLHPPGKPQSLRVDHWPKVIVPCLFLEGTHDPFCNVELLERHLPELGAKSEVILVPGGDHSLRVSGARAPNGVSRSEAEVLAGLAPDVSGWLNSLPD